MSIINVKEIKKDLPRKSAAAIAEKTGKSIHTVRAVLNGRFDNDEILLEALNIIKLRKKLFKNF